MLHVTVIKIKYIPKYLMTNTTTAYLTEGSA